MSHKLQELFRIDSGAKPGEDIQKILCSFSKENLLNGSGTAPSVPDTAGDGEG